jgi:hypothetical protein
MLHLLPFMMAEAAGQGSTGLRIVVQEIQAVMQVRAFVLLCQGASQQGLVMAWLLGPPPQSHPCTLRCVCPALRDVS